MDRSEIVELEREEISTNLHNQIVDEIKREFKARYVRDIKISANIDK